VVKTGIGLGAGVIASVILFKRKISLSPSPSRRVNTATPQLIKLYFTMFCVCVSLFDGRSINS